MRKVKKAQLLIITLVIIFLALSPVMAWAQDAGDLPCDGNDPYSNYCPLDTWSIVLVVAGAALGIYKLYKLNKTNRNIA